MVYLNCSGCGEQIAVGEISDRLNFIDNCPRCGKKIEWQRLFLESIIKNLSKDTMNRMYPGTLEQMQQEEEERKIKLQQIKHNIPAWFT